MKERNYRLMNLANCPSFYERQEDVEGIGSALDASKEIRKSREVGRSCLNLCR
jgi:hypothetical protein